MVEKIWQIRKRRQQFSVRLLYYYCGRSKYRAMIQGCPPPHLHHRNATGGLFSAGLTDNTINTRLMAKRSESKSSRLGRSRPIGKSRVIKSSGVVDECIQWNASAFLPFQLCLSGRDKGVGFGPLTLLS